MREATSPEQILGVRSDASREEIMAAYSQKLSYWQLQLSKPEKAAEAERQRRLLDNALESILTKFSPGEGRLASPVSPPTPGFRVSGQDTDGCPHCGYTDNPEDARYCLNCAEPLFRSCPNCHSDITWTQHICHHCGIDIDAFEEQQLEEDEERNRELERQRLEREQRERLIRQLVTQDWPSHLRAHLKTLPLDQREEMLAEVRKYREIHSIPKPSIYRTGIIAGMSIVTLFLFPFLGVVPGYALMSDPEGGCGGKTMGVGCLIYGIIGVIAMFFVLFGGFFL